MDIVGNAERSLSGKELWGILKNLKNKKKEIECFYLIIFSTVA